MFMTAQMRQQYRIQTESGEMVAGGFDQEALAGPRDRETVPGAENAIPEADKTSSPGGGFEATGKNAHPITSSKSPVVAHEASEAASFDVVGPDPVEGKDGVWLVEYTWKYGKASVAFVETFTIEDYKIKKLKRSRG